MFCNGRHCLAVESRVAFVALEHCDDCFRAGLRSVAGERRKRAVDDINTRLNRLKISGVAETARAVRVQFDGDIQAGFEFFYEVVGGIRCKQAGHIFNADGVATHFLHLFCKLNEHFICMNGAYRVNQAALDFGLFGTSKRGFNRDAKITNIVKRVEDTKDANAVSRSVLNKFFHNVVGIVIVA